MTPSVKVAASPNKHAFPSPLQLQQSKRAGFTVTIGLPGGRSIRLSTYLRSWKKLLTLPPQTSVANWEWYPVSAGEILRRLSEGVHDRINRHLPWFEIMYRYGHTNPPHDRRIRAKLDRLVQRGLLKCECRWCGTAFSFYQPNPYNRFCDASCRRAFNS